MNTAILTAETYGLTTTNPGKPVDTQALQEQLEALLQDPRREQKLATFENASQLPQLTSTEKAPHPREIRYLFMSNKKQILPEAAQRLTEPSVWYALAGMN